MSDQLFTWVARGLVLFTAMPIHECAHGYTAYRLGDNTAKEQGRLTLNPFAHLDMLGSILLVFAGFGWAKPVQVDPRNFKNPKRDMAITALAGPLSNILLATVVLILTKLLFQIWPLFRVYTTFLQGLLDVLLVIITTNLYLAVFNLLPVPPLDGSKIFGAFLPDKYYFFVMRNQRYIALLLFVLIFTGVLAYPLQRIASFLLVGLDTLTFFLGRLF